MQKDLNIKVDEFGDGLSGLVQPRSGTLVGNLLCTSGMVLDLTNTGPTNLTFNVSEVIHNGQSKDQYVLQPGELKSLYFNGSSDGKNKTLYVSNAHPHKEGSFIILIKEGKIRVPSRK
jgi:hypothetical protein